MPDLLRGGGAGGAGGEGGWREMSKEQGEKYRPRDVPMPGAQEDSCSWDFSVEPDRQRRGRVRRLKPLVPRVQKL